MSRTLRVPLFPAAGRDPVSALAASAAHFRAALSRNGAGTSIDGAGRIAMIQPLRLDDDNRAPLYGVGCVGEVVGVEELEDGRYNIVLLGSNRFRLVQRGRGRRALSLRRSRHRGSSTTASRRRWRSSSAPKSSARRGGSAMRSGLRSIGRRSAARRRDAGQCDRAGRAVRRRGEAGAARTGEPRRPRRPARPAHAVPPRRGDRRRRGRADFSRTAVRPPCAPVCSMAETGEPHIEG